MLENSGNSMYMPVAPAYNGNDMFGGNGMWFLLLWMAMFGWGGNGFMGNGNGYNNVQRGFDQQAIMSGINGILPAVQNGFAQAEISANARQMADMNQYFQMQNSFQQCLTKIRKTIRRIFSTKYNFYNGTCTA